MSRKSSLLSSTIRSHPATLQRSASPDPVPSDCIRDGRMQPIAVLVDRIVSRVMTERADRANR